MMDFYDASYWLSQLGVYPSKTQNVVQLECDTQLVQTSINGPCDFKNIWFI